jgi:hypothetical protein
MPISKPYKRTTRQLLDGTYSNSGNWQYLIHKDFAQDPQHYIRAFMIIQKDLINLFEFIEPCDQNLQTISFRTHELLMRTCIEIEANFTAILRKNIYSKRGNLNIDDYKIINKSHRLSTYKVSLPIWKGDKRFRKPFKEWDNNMPLKWYQAYNKSKHDRHENFDKATFDNLLDAVGGLVILLSAQFNTEDYSPNEKGLSIGPSYSYGSDDGMETGIGGYFRILFPTDWPLEERYSFQWQTLGKQPNPIDKINYDDLMNNLG